jgi:hypothetical protein
MHIQICSMRIQNTPVATSSSVLCSYWLIQRRGGSYLQIPSLAHFFHALTTSWRHQVLLYAYADCGGSCSLCIQNVAGAAHCALKILRELLYLYHKGWLKIYIQEPVWFTFFCSQVQRAAAFKHYDKIEQLP